MAAPIAVDFSKLYPRTFELESGSELTFYQSEIGDVGCVVWDAAIVLSKYLEKVHLCKDVSWHGKTVLELGAGTGAVGLVAAHLGATTIITDLPDFIALMQYNVKQNFPMIVGSCHVSSLAWGDESQAKTIKAAHFPEGLDYLIIADCVYYEESVELLVNTIVQVSAAKTTVLCCYEERDLGNKPELQKRFFQMISEHFDVSEIPLCEQDSRFSSPDIHIMKFRLKPKGGR